MTFVTAAKIYLQSDISSFTTMHLALIDKKNSNIQYEIINYNGSIINIWPAVDKMLQVYLNDALEKEDDLTEIYNFLQEKIISQKEFDIMTENKIGIFPQKILLGTKDGYKMCGLYNKATHILNIDKIKFRINLPEHLNNCIVSVDIMRIEI